MYTVKNLLRGDAAEDPAHGKQDGHGLPLGESALCSPDTDSPPRVAIILTSQFMNIFVSLFEHYTSGNTCKCMFLCTTFFFFNPVIGLRDLVLS